MSQTLTKLNSLSYEEFTEIFANIVERCPVFAAGVWSRLPLSDLDLLGHAFHDELDKAPTSLKEGVLRCHPDLAGRLALTHALSAESTGEQQAAGLLHLSDEEKQILGRLNDAYKAKFGFPFIICVRQNKKEAIFRGIEQRLNNSREQELATAVEEVKKIGTLRLNDILDKLAYA